MTGHTFKFVVVGETESGKRTLVSRIRRVDNPVYEIGIEHPLERRIDGNTVQATIADLDRTERFRYITSSSYNHADVVVVMFDASAMLDEQGLVQWIEDAKRYTTTGVVIALVGNKKDVKSNGFGATTEKITQIATENAIKHSYHLSALTDISAVERMFSELLREAYLAWKNKHCKKGKKSDRCVVL